MDDEALLRELDKLEDLCDDLYLDDVGSVGPSRGGKFSKRRGRGIGGRGFMRAKASRGRGTHKEDIFDISPPEPENYDKWDLDHSDDNNRDFHVDSEGFEPVGSGFHSQSHAKGVVRRQPKVPYRSRGGKHPGSVGGRPFDNRMSDMFDIESKPQHEEDRNERNSSRSRESRSSPGFRAHGSDADNTEKQSPRFPRTDPRLVGKTEYDSRFGLYKRNDPRLSQRSEGSNSEHNQSRADTRAQQSHRGRDAPECELYDGIKDPRTQQSDKGTSSKKKEVTDGKEKKESEVPFVPIKIDLETPPKVSDHLRRFENRFLPVSDDPRLASKSYNSRNSDKTIFEKIGSAPVLLENQIPGLADVKPPEPKKLSQPIRRGPHSPSPISPSSPVNKKDRNGSPASSRKRDSKHSPVRTSNRGSRWDRSHSPVRGRVDRSVSPRRRKRKDRSGSREHPRERSHEWKEWSGSPHRKSSRRDRSPPSNSPRRRRRSRSNRSTSLDRGYGRSPDRRHDRSLSHHSLSPRQRHISSARDLTSGHDREEHWTPNIDRQPPLVGQPPPNMPIGGQPRYPAQPPPGYEMHPPGMYSEPYRQPPPPNYGPPLPGGGPPPPGYGVPYQQQQPHYHYDNYEYPHPPYPEYAAPPPPGPGPPGTWGPDRNLVYPDLSQPPPASQPQPPTAAPPAVPPPPQVDAKAEEAKKEAIKNEVLQQKQTLSKQREEYFRKSTIILRELQRLRVQAEKCKDNERILRENHKLQLEIQNKLKAIDNVIDMLTGIIGDKKEMDEKKAQVKAKVDKKPPKTPPETPPKSSSESPEPVEMKMSEPPVPGEGAGPLPGPAPVPVPPPAVHGGSTSTPAPAVTGAAPVPSDDKKPVFNYVHYDPEMHWCRVCDVFPRTAKEFLNHLHSAEHKEVTMERKLVDMPWHKVQTEEEVSYIKGAPTKRTPIRGLQFFISATAWYCKLCDTWIGDLHCASLHLKSKIHTEKYVNFTEQNPHWETDWLADREKAYERKSDERRQLRDSQPEAASSQPVPAPAVKKSTPDKEDKSKKNKKERTKKDRKGKEEKEGKKKKRKKKAKKKGKTSSGSDSSSSSSSSSSEEGSDGEEDKSKSIRVAMRNKFKSLGNQPLEKELPSAYTLKTTGGWQNVELKEDLESLEKERIYKEEQELYEKEQREQAEYERLEKERHEREKSQREDREVKFRRLPQKEDKMLREWMDSNKEQVSEGEKQILSSIKDRVKLKQEEEKNKKRDERDRYYEKGYYDDGYRRRRRGESPDNRGGKRRSRSPDERRPDERRSDERRPDERRPDERRWDRSKNDKYRKSPQRTASSSSRGKEGKEGSYERKIEVDKKSSVKHVEVAEPDEAETKFEKQAAEAAARLKKKDKKPLATNVPKSKLPFIGRMPIMKHLAKKKGDDESDKIGSKAPKAQAQASKLPIIGPALPPGMILPHLSTKPSIRPEDQGAGAVVQDMDIDDEDSNGATGTVMEEQVPVSIIGPKLAPKEECPSLYSDVDVSHEDEGDVKEAPPGVDEQPAAIEVPPVVTESTADPHSKKAEGDAPLPKDFQDALNILFGDKKPPGESKPAEESEPTPEHEWPQEMMGPGPHQMPGYGPMMGMHPMYSNMGPQGMAGSPGYHQMNPDMPHGMMGPRDMSPHGMMGPGPQDRPPHGMGPQDMPPHGMMGPQDRPPHGMMGPQDMPPHMMGPGPPDRPPHGMIGPQDMPPHGMMGPGPHDRPPHGMMGPQDMPPHGMMGPQDMPPHGMMGPQDMPPHGMMGPGPPDRPPHGMMGPQDMPPHGMMGHPDMPPHGMMGYPDMPPHGMMGPQERPPHGMMGPGPQDRPPHGMMGPGPQDRPPHGMMGPGPPDRPPHGMMGPGPQDRPPHGMMGPGPQDRPPHSMMGPGPQDRPPHGMMGPGPQDRPPHGMMGPQDRPPHGMMGPGPQDRPPHGMMGPGPPDRPHHGMMGPGPPDRPPHGMMGPGPQDRPPHGMMGPGPQDRPPHGMMGSGPQDRPPHGMMGHHDGPPGPKDMPNYPMLGPQDIPLHLIGPDIPRPPPPPPPPKQTNSDSDHSDNEGDKMNRRAWGDDDLAILGMDAQDMAAQNM